MSNSRRDEIITAVSDYYEFLTTLFLPNEDLKRVPPGGWDKINETRFGYLEKDPRVIELLKYLPFVAHDDKYKDPYQIARDTLCNDFSGRWLDNNYDPESTEGMEDLLTEHSCEDINDPPNPTIATLSRGASENGTFIFCDIETYSLFSCDLQNGDENYYANARQLFDRLKDDLCTLRFYPMERSIRKYQGLQIDKDICDIYRKHGWPTASYRKDEALAEVAEYVKGAI